MNAPDDDAGAANPKRPPRKHVPQACDACRTKRTGCKNGRPPPNAQSLGQDCDGCKAEGVPCTWDPTPDGRKGITKVQYDAMSKLVQAKTQQIEALRERLRVAGLPEDLPSEGEANSADESDADEDLSRQLDERLVLDEISRTPMYFGAASPFADFEPAEHRINREAAIKGYLHSTSRMMKDVSPMHILRLTTGDWEDSESWYAYLPRNEDGSRIINRVQHDEAIELFLRFFSAWTLRIIPTLFLRDLAKLTESPHPKPEVNHFSPMLHCFVVAVALAYSSDPALRSKDLRDKFVEEGMKHLSREAQRPKLSTVQSFAIVSSYYNGVGEQTLGFMYFGMAERMAQTLGLHVRIPDGTIDNDDRIERYWVFWNIFVSDKLWALFVGRNQGLPTTQVQMESPPLDYRMDMSRWHWITPQRKVIDEPAYLSSNFQAASRLSRLASDVMRVVYDEHLGLRLSWKIAQIGEIWHKLKKWHEHLKPELKIMRPSTDLRPAHIFMLNSAYEWILLLLLRPFHVPNVKQLAFIPPSGRRSGMQGTTLPEAELANLCKLANDECPRAAERILELNRAYDKHFTLRLAPLTTVQITFSAGKTYLQTVAAGITGKPRAVGASSRARTKVRECVEHLRLVGETFATASTTADILEKELAAELEKLGTILDVDAAPASSPTTARASARAKIVLNTVPIAGPAFEQPPTATRAEGDRPQPASIGKRPRQASPNASPTPQPQKRPNRQSTLPPGSLQVDPYSISSVAGTAQDDWLYQNINLPEAYGGTNSLDQSLFDLLPYSQISGQSMSIPPGLTSQGVFQQPPSIYAPPFGPPPSTVQYNIPSSSRSAPRLFRPTPLQTFRVGPSAQAGDTDNEATTLAGPSMATSMNRWFNSGEVLPSAPASQIPALPFMPHPPAPSSQQRVGSGAVGGAGHFYAGSSVPGANANANVARGLGAAPQLTPAQLWMLRQSVTTDDNQDTDEYMDVSHDDVAM